MREDGFFYVKGFNISQERVNRQFAIGKNFYAETPLEEKLKYVPEGLGARSCVGGQCLRLTGWFQTTVLSMDMSLLGVACKWL